VIEPRRFRLLVTWFDLSPSCHTVESTCHLCKYNVHYWDTYLSVFFYEVNNHDRWWIFHLPIQGISGYNSSAPTPANGEGSLMTTRTANWLAGDHASIACIFGGHQLCMGAVYFRSIRFYNGLLIQCAGMSVDMQCWTTAWISAKHLHIS